MLAVALLRGINVGGKARVPMEQLRSSFESLGCTDVHTYIASGNVVFATPDDVGTETTLRAYAPVVEARLEADFGFEIAILLRSHRRLRKGVARIPADWENDKLHKTDVLFLFDAVDKPATLAGLRRNDDVDEACYAPGLIAWRVLRAKATRSRLTAIMGTPLYRQVTIRNVTTARKLLAMLDERQQGR